MENFAVGEIIWAKIRGYPWWPAMITGLVDENKEKKYVVGFIGDNTHSILQKQKLAKFQKEYKNFANTKKRTLLESIRLAKEMIENKGKADDFEKMKRNTPDEKSAKEGNRNKNKNKESEISYEDSEVSEEESPKIKKSVSNMSNMSNVPNVPIATNIPNLPKTKKIISPHKNENLEKEKDHKDLTKLKRRRTEDKKENQGEVNDLMKRIINYLLFVSKNIESFSWDTNKELLLKIFEYLKEYKIGSPIEFLKKTSLGIMIKYINSKVEDKDIQEYSNLVYRNFEEQVLDQLFKNK